MANDLTDSPWRIDTASATAITTDRIRIKFMRWEGSETLADQAIIQDKNGKQFWSAKNDVGASFQTESLFEVDIDGIIVPTLAAGVLNIHFH